MRCFVCNHDSWGSVYKDLVICKKCRFIRARDKFFNQKPENVYNKSYYTKGQYADYEKERVSLTKNFRERLKQIIKYKNGGDLLDVGCAYGFFLLEAKKYFKPIGIDLDKDTVRKAREISRIDTILGDFLKIIFHKKFDVITFFDSIEHMKDPGATIRKTRTLLKKDGIVAIETGDIGSILPKIQKAKWRIIDPNLHLSYFSNKTLTKLLETNGFEIINITYVPFRRSLKQIIHRLAPSQTAPQSLLNFSLKLNTYDIMFVIAKKKSKPTYR